MFARSSCSSFRRRQANLETAEWTIGNLHQIVYGIQTIKLWPLLVEIPGMRIFQIMRGSEPRRRRRMSADGRATVAFERTALQLAILVAMANVDGEILASEYERLHAIADRISTADTRDRVVGQLQMLIAAPPTDEDVLRSLIAAGGVGRLTRQLVDDIADMARADETIHPAEERLLRLMSAIGGAKPLSLRSKPASLLDSTELALLDRLTCEVHERAEREREGREDAA